VPQWLWSYSIWINIYRESVNWNISPVMVLQTTFNNISVDGETRRPVASHGQTLEYDHNHWGTFIYDYNLTPYLTNISVISSVQYFSGGNRPRRPISPLRYGWLSVVEHQVENISICLMVFSATFNNISGISWRSVLLVEDYPKKTTDVNVLKGR
jgi:hypothetical protein